MDSFIFHGVQGQGHMTLGHVKQAPHGQGSQDPDSGLQKKSMNLLNVFLLEKSVSIIGLKVSQSLSLWWTKRDTYLRITSFTKHDILIFVVNISYMKFHIWNIPILRAWLCSQALYHIAGSTGDCQNSCLPGKFIHESILCEK